MRLIYISSIVFILSVFFNVSTSGQTTPPSSVITAPHSNAYFMQGTDVVIRVHASTAGGSFPGGTVTRVEFFSNGVLIGESTTPASSNTFTYTWSGVTTRAVANIYTFVWRAVPAGTYRITARAYASTGNVSTSAGVIIHAGSTPARRLGMSACKGKYVGNIIQRATRGDFTNYWNGVTSENHTKWGELERTRNVMTWTNADLAYNFARNNNIPFRFHAIAWGSQYPLWLETNPREVPPVSALTPAQFQAEIDQLMSLVAARYPFMDQVEVLNEIMHTVTHNEEEHAPGTPMFRAGLGGPGVTGHDWAIWLFERARHHFPNSKLVLNDFELETNHAGRQQLLDLIKVLRDRNLIDGFGTQAHTFNVDGQSASTIQNALNHMAQSGLPLYVTELDLQGRAGQVTDAGQLASYQSAFPVYWNHPAVAGITLWGYVQGTMWQPNAWLLSSATPPVERPALVWLRDFLAARPDVGFPCCPPVSTNVSDFESQVQPPNVELFPNPVTSGRFLVNFNREVYADVSIAVYNQLGKRVFNQTFEPSIQYEIDLAGNENGLYFLHISTGSRVNVKRLVLMQ